MSVPVPSQNQDFKCHMLSFYVQWFEERGDCWFCWYWWNCWQSIVWTWPGFPMTLCSMIWGERWLLVLFILVELLTIILFELSFYNFVIYFNYLNVKALCLIIKKWLKSVMSRRQLRNVDIWLLRCNSQLYYGVCLCCLN